MTKTSAQKKAYHKMYYQKNMKKLRQIARIRYWSLHYGKKPPSLSIHRQTDKEEVKSERSPKPKKQLNIKKGTFILNFD